MLDDRPWEPPLAGTESEHLLGALDRLRTTFLWKVDDLDAAALRSSMGVSAVTPGGLLKHLAFVEDLYSTFKLNGASPGPPWETVDWDADPDWPWHSAAHDTPEQLYALWTDAVERSRSRLRAALSDGGLDQLVHVDDAEGHYASLRRMLCDLVEEYGRHTGHADLIRENLDGRVGEDPPPGWRPAAGRIPSDG
jgi:hypothetical protein